jgi:hypothetical protein
LDFDRLCELHESVLGELMAIGKSAESGEVFVIRVVKIVLLVD